MAVKILLVEDDAVIASAIAKHLGSWGWEVRVAEDFSDVVGEFTRSNPQLVLLDISLPFFNGFHWCSEIRRFSKTPVIFLSSAGDSMNIVMAMNMGGDDFISKPFDLMVLTAKIQALLRRAYDFGGSPELMRYRDGVLNLSEASFTYESGKIELTRNELRILEMLLLNRGRIVSREALMKRLWESDSFVDENTLSVNVTRLRKKLEAAGLTDAVRTRKGAGYIIE